ncbi:hypothetical protein ACQPX6_04865 [Actinomycetospora sp. CA-101289]|uniref:hypothetical protein n=1 Tax=Actinomycetospora sp. CA-101289 TaxID=3239893 RepID=UPI003D994B49
MIAHVPGTDRTLDIATEIDMPRPRPAEPTLVPAPDTARDPFLVAAQLESSAVVLTWLVRLALLVVVGLAVLVAVL